MARPTKPGNTERGWNDPPVFLYSNNPPADAGLAAAPKRPLTKRVAYVDAPSGANGVNVEGKTECSLPFPPPPPLQGKSSVEHGCLIPQTLPPAAFHAQDDFPHVQLFPPSSTTELPQFAAPIIVPTMIQSEDGILRPVPVVATNPVSATRVVANETSDVLQIPNFNDDEQMFHYVITRLQRALKDCQTVVEPKVAEDIQKKINIFSDMWKNGKVSYPVKSTMARLSTAIHRRQCAVAQELHLGLMIDHVSEVSKWLIGIKRLIQEVEKVDKPLSPSAVCIPSSEPFFQPLVPTQDEQMLEPDAANSHASGEPDEQATVDKSDVCFAPDELSESSNKTELYLVEGESASEDVKAHTLNSSSSSSERSILSSDCCLLPDNISKDDTALSGL